MLHTCPHCEAVIKVWIAAGVLTYSGNRCEHLVGFELPEMKPMYQSSYETY